VKATLVSPLWILILLFCISSIASARV
jgi:hypothetical protein